MNIGQTFGVAMKNLLAHKLRCVQVMLAMVVGVSAAVAILALGSNLLQGVGAYYAAYSPTMMFFGVYTSVENSPRVTVEDMEGLVDSSEYITAVTPVVFMHDNNLRYNGETLEKGGVTGVNEQFLQMVPAYQVAAGRFLQPMDISRRQNVCVVGSAVAQELLGCGDLADALGETLKINNENFTIIGVFGEVKPDMEELNYGVCIPYPCAKPLTEETIIPLGDKGDYYFEPYYVDLNSTDNIINGRDTVRQLLVDISGRPFGETALLFSLSMRTSQNYDNEVVVLLIMKLLALSGVVLLVGGVGIMSIMLAAVSERRQEIGIRKAFGATAGDVKRQFILEALYTSGFGALLGALLGIPAGWLVCRFLGSVPIGYNGMLMVNPELLDLPALLLPALGVGAVATLLGVLFGSYPAAKAAKMEIVDSLRD